MVHFKISNRHPSVKTIKFQHADSYIGYHVKKNEERSGN